MKLNYQITEEFEYSPYVNFINNLKLKFFIVSDYNYKYVTNISYLLIINDLLNIITLFSHTWL